MIIKEKLQTISSTFLRKYQIKCTFATL